MRRILFKLAPCIVLSHSTFFFFSFLCFLYHLTCSLPLYVFVIVQVRLPHYLHFPRVPVLVPWATLCRSPVQRMRARCVCGGDAFSSGIKLVWGACETTSWRSVQEAFTVGPMLWTRLRAGAKGLGVFPIDMVNESPTLVKGKSVEPEEHPRLRHTQPKKSSQEEREDGQRGEGNSRSLWHPEPR